MKNAFSLLLAAVIIGFGADYVSAQNFGGAAVISGDDVIIGQSGQNTTNSTVRIYRKGDDGAWTKTSELVAPDNDGSDDRFGRALAADDMTLAVGATLVDNSTGSVYVYGRSGSDSWEFRDTLRPDDIMEGDSFGRAIAIDGDWMIVGTAGHNEQTGAAYVYRRGGDGGWSQHSKLVADDTTGGDFFGLTVALDSGTALVAAPYKGENNDGAVYVFAYDESADSWNAAGTLAKFPGVLDESQFGMGLAIDGGTAVVGMPALGGGIGGAAIYRGTGSGWNITGVVLPFSVSSPGSGSLVQVVDEGLWMGGSGTVYVYEADESGQFVSSSALTGGEVSNWGTAAAISGNVAVVGAGGADGGLGAAYILERERDDWAVVQRLETEYTDRFPSVTGGQVNCADGKAESWDCADIDLLSFMNIGDLGGGRGVEMNDVWGWTDPQSGREYAIAGRTNGTSFVDVTDPLNPVYIGDLPMTEGSQANTWRDMKVYDNHVFIVADGAGPHGMQVFDLTRLRSTSNTPATFEADFTYDGIASAHNIVINEETGFAYAVGSNSGGETCGGGLHMIDIQDPKNPVFAGCFGHEGTGNAGTGYSHDAMCVVYDGPDDEHDGKEICFGANETALSIADVTDKENPVALASAAYPNVGYTHQGWITEDHSYFYVNDELDETGGNAERTRTLIWDITDLDEPELVKEHFGTTTASDHNLYIRDNLMYQSNYSAGLQIMDITDPENPVQVGMFDVDPTGDTPGFNGTWSNYPYFGSGTIVVTGKESGLYMLKKREIDI